MTQQTDLKGQHDFILCYFVYTFADPATFLTSNNDLSLKKRFYSVLENVSEFEPHNTVNIKIQILHFFCKTTQYSFYIFYNSNNFFLLVLSKVSRHLAYKAVVPFLHRFRHHREDSD